MSHLKHDVLEKKSQLTLPKSCQKVDKKVTKMQFGLVLLASQVASVLSYGIVGGSVTIGGSSIEFGEFSTQEIKQLSLQSKDKIDIQLLIDELPTKPHQAVITLGDGEGLDISFIPSVVPSKREILLSIPFSKIPDSLKVLPKLFLKVILADKGNQANLHKQLVEVVPSRKLRNEANAAYKPSERVGLKPEIHHTFKNDPQTINPVIPLAFIGGALVLFLGLIVSWVSFIGSGSLGAHFQDLSGSQIIYDLLFLLCLIGYEVTFVKYYLGSSIFSTLLYSFVLAGPSIYFGSKVLQSFAKARKIGKV